jgi:hypothetical protein
VVATARLILQMIFAVRWKETAECHKAMFQVRIKHHFVEQCPVALPERRFVPKVDGGGTAECVCFTCGLAGHFPRDCNFERKVLAVLASSRKRGFCFESDSSSSDYSVDGVDHGDACFRCGRSGHWSNECYVTYDVSGRRIQ